MERTDFSRLNEQTFDIIVIGGGIIGAGIARDAALRGLKIALFEKNDFASGTTSAPTRLIHGGLRYLEHFDFALVRKDLKEREILLRWAPHLVKPLPFLVPFWSRSMLYRLKLKTGMLLYDLLSYDKSLPNHTFLNREETLHLEPKLNPLGLQGAMRYYDAIAPLTERLTLENILDAHTHGAQVWNHTTVIGLQRQDQRIHGVQVRHEPTGETIDISARLVINAAGPWLDMLSSKLLEQPSQRVRMTKGIHFTAPPTSNNALVLFTSQDNRLFFVVPWQGYAWVGTTDTDYHGIPDDVRATGEDVHYLVNSVEKFLPDADWKTIYYTTAGIRALARKEGISASAVSRKHMLIDYEKEEGLHGLIAVVGGKLTAYRGIAQDAVDLACKKLKVSTKSQTAARALPGAQLPGTSPEQVPDQKHITDHLQSEGKKLTLSEAQLNYLIEVYGTLALRLFALMRSQAELQVRIHPNYPDVVAQIHYAIMEEYCKTVEDFMLRRTKLGFTHDRGVAALKQVAEVMGNVLGWSTTEIEEQCAHYLATIEQSLLFRTELTQASVVSPG